MPYAGMGDSHLHLYVTLGAVTSTVLYDMQQLGIFNGDAVLLKGKKRKDTVCIALVEDGLEDSSIRMSKVRRTSSPLAACGASV